MVVSRCSGHFRRGQGGKLYASTDRRLFAVPRLSSPSTCSGLWVLFADNGLLAVLLDAPTSPLLLIVGLIVVSGYIAQTLRPAAASATSARRRWPARFILAVTTGYPPVSALMGVALLPALAASPDPIQYAGYLETAESYFGVLDSLAAWSLLLLFPILLIRLAATKWPAIGNALPSPVAFVSALAVTIILFEEHGILAVTYEYPTSGLMSALCSGHCPALPGMGTPPGA